MTRSTSPFAAANPATTADARPSFPARRTTVIGCSFAFRPSAMAAVPSGDPSSTTTSSHSRPANAVARRSTRRGSESASL